jgi:two-component system sensor histidine kinase UhpB
MSLLVGLTLRLVGVALVCLALAVAWVVVDANRMIGAETAASADRVASQLARRSWLGSADRAQRRLIAGRQTDFERKALALVKAVGPGVCVELPRPARPDERVCGGWEGIGTTAPRWFATLFAGLFDAGPPVRRSIAMDGEAIQEIVVSPDPVAAATRAWHQVRIVAGMAAAMALGMSLLAWPVLAHALAPAQTIVRGLKRLERGDYAGRLPGFRVAEFGAIASAVNDLASRLARTTAERSALMRRLFEVQEDERRALARELHDEFGQCLTAAGALAASIEAGTPEGRPDLAEDARAIRRVTAQMMTTLRGAFARLRPPDLDEIGLEASLRNMVAGWNAIGGNRVAFRLDVDGSLAAVPARTAVEVYRIAQECLTNAARHGRPSRVSVRVSGAGAGGGAVGLVVDDDGGGDPGQVAAAPGFGILGIRERIAALGGSLSIGRSDGGLRIAAVIPAAAEAGA